jgi:hypothetical protein
MATSSLSPDSFISMRIVMTQASMYGVIAGNAEHLLDIDERRCHFCRPIVHFALIRHRRPFLNC